MHIDFQRRGEKERGERRGEGEEMGQKERRENIREVRREGRHRGRWWKEKRREEGRHKGTTLLFLRLIQYNQLLLFQHQSGPHDNCPGFRCMHLTQQHTSIINRLEIRHSM